MAIFTFIGIITTILLLLIIIRRFKVQSKRVEQIGIRGWNNMVREINKTKI